MWRCDSKTLVNHMIQLFSKPKILFDYYNWMEIESGFWFLPSPYGFMGALLDPQVKREKRELCIVLMKNLFTDVFSQYENGSAGYMWWESLIIYTIYSNVTIDRSDVFETLVSIINEVFKMEDKGAKASAEHGIQHLKELANP